VINIIPLNKFRQSKRLDPNINFFDKTSTK